MSQQDLKQLIENHKKWIEERYKKMMSDAKALEKKAELQREGALASLEQLRTEASIEATDSPLESNGKSRTERIRDLILGLDEEFEQREIAQKAKRLGIDANENIVKKAIFTLRKDGRIEVVSKSTGRNSAKYRNKKKEGVR